MGKSTIDQTTLTYEVNWPTTLIEGKEGVTHPPQASNYFIPAGKFFPSRQNMNWIGREKNIN
jgi:hypothetical protein